MNNYLTTRINKTNYCWLWTGSVGWDGYGRASNKGKSQMAHRAVYEALKGKIPSSMVIDHLCRNKICVNPEHLEVTSQRENILRGDTQAGKNAKKTHCINGHDLAQAYVDKKRGWRVCRPCRNAKNVRYQKRKRAEKRKLQVYP